METMNSSNTYDGSQDEPKKPKRAWTPEKNLAWELDSGATRDKLESEIIADAHYKEHIPALKTKFNELFNFEPRVTNSFIMDLDDFLSHHNLLKYGKSIEGIDIKLLAQSSRTAIREWVGGEFFHHSYKPDTTPEYEEEVRVQRREILNNIDQLYVWIFQNIPVKQK
jgi:hypothetical protein